MLHIYNLFQRKQVLFFEYEIFEQNLKHLKFENSQLFLNMKTWFNVQGKGSFVQQNDNTMHTLAPMH
jgi:hypothetical protein